MFIINKKFLEEIKFINLAKKRNFIVELDKEIEKYAKVKNRKLVELNFETLNEYLSEIPEEYSGFYTNDITQEKMNYIFLKKEIEDFKEVMKTRTEKERIEYANKNYGTDYTYEVPEEIKELVEEVRKIAKELPLKLREVYFNEEQVENSEKYIELFQMLFGKNYNRWNGYIRKQQLNYLKEWEL